MAEQQFEPTVTICSDASVSKRYGIATWACYIRTPKGAIKQGGICKEPTDHSDVAERYGIANALYIASKAVDLHQYRIVLYCDNKAALTPPRSSNKTGRHKQKAIKMQVFYTQNIQKYLHMAKGYEVRHVKGHLDKSLWSTVSKRNYLNDWCDKEAHRQMGIAINKVLADAALKEQLT